MLSEQVIIMFYMHNGEIDGQLLELHAYVMSNDLALNCIH